jgi:alanyl-tRNA synthetase
VIAGLVDLAKFVESVPPTRTVYQEDSYLQTLEGSLLKVVQEKNTAYVALNYTLFHPKSGGQPSDVGTIEGASFRVDVKRAMFSGEVVVHYGKVQGTPNPGPVTCKIDWPNRFLLMRRHTAGHLLDYCFTESGVSRVETTDSWLGDDPYVGYGGAAPQNLSIQRVQELANGHIQQGASVEVETVDRAAAEQLIASAPNLLRLPKSDKLRIVTIEGQLAIPCGGTHVRNLNEIGNVEVRRIQPAETGFRLHFDVK